MAFGIPGLTEALEDLDTAMAQMVELVNGIKKVTELLEEQNRILEAIAQKSL